MKAFRLANFVAGALAVTAISFASNASTGRAFIGGLEEKALAARAQSDGNAIAVRFTTAEGWLTRHPRLFGGDEVGQELRTQVAEAILRVPGVGGVSWAGDPAQRAQEAASFRCKDDVEGVLAARSVRFTEASARIEPESDSVLDEVAQALQPCVGAIIAITGHTDGNGNPAANLALSQARAEAVRWALIGRGIPGDGLRAQGRGSQERLEGLDPLDPANRRIECSVIEAVPIKPTPIDVPGAG